jgi:hypothetical protein
MRRTLRVTAMTAVLVLLWSRDGVTLRLESAAALDRAVAIAGSLRATDAVQS